MFILLMNLKRAQLHLRSTWIHHRDNDANHRYPSYRRLWMLRHSVALFLDSFATYIQADVITPHYTHLTALLHDYTAKRRGEGDVKMGTLDLAKTHRENYLAPIMARSFIRVPAVVEALREMVDVAMGLGRNMQAVFQSGDSVTQERSFTEFATELDRLQEVCCYCCEEHGLNTI